MISTKDFLIKDILGESKGSSSDGGIETRLRVIRNEVVDKPIIFIGAGTCGLGAGAGKTLESVKAYLKVNNIDARVIETGCIGLCSSEPLMDVQLPGRSRLCFEKVNAEQVDGILSSLLGPGLVPEHNILGQYCDKLAEPWGGINEINNHPFLGHKKELYLKIVGFATL